MTPAYNRSHATKLEYLVRTVGKARTKMGLTVEEMLAALRYEVNPDEFSRACNEADQTVKDYMEFTGSVISASDELALLDGIAQGFNFGSFAKADQRSQSVIRNLAKAKLAA